MTTTERPRPEKRALVVRCEHQSTELCECRLAALTEVLARWPPPLPGQPAEQPGREAVVLADIREPLVRPPYQRPEPLQIIDEDERYGDSLLGAFGAWACVAFSVLLLLILTIRQLWLWLFV